MKHCQVLGGVKCECECEVVRVTLKVKSVSVNCGANLCGNIIYVNYVSSCEGS